MAQEIWKMEERLWLEGGPAFAALLHRDCLMAFAPTGLIQGEAIRKGLDDFPRWSSALMTGRVMTRPAGPVRVLGYRVRAQRDGDEPYVALCSSTWLETPRGWRLVQHQHSALD
jgi:hypothetical protein